MLWDKLEQLKECCDVSFECHNGTADGIPVWRFTYTRRGDPNARPVVHEAKEITKAVRLGIDAAQLEGLLSK